MSNPQHPYAGGPRKAVVAVICRDQRLLLIKRSEQVRAPGKWCFPGGSLEPAEDEQSGLRRELLEELQLRGEPTKRLWRSTTPWGVEIAWWSCRIAHDAAIIPNATEVAECNWLTVDQMAALEALLPSNRQFLAAHAAGEFQLI